MKLKNIGIIFLIAIMALAMVGCGEDGSSSDSGEYTMKHGELISAEENDLEQGKVLVVKAKTGSGFTNKQVVKSNYMNVADLITNQGCDKFDEIQYWAVADMTSGEESKIISFTLDADTIKGVADGNIVDIQLGDYVKDLWIHPSLQE